MGRDPRYSTVQYLTAEDCFLGGVVDDAGTVGYCDGMETETRGALINQ
jgi:hypothetical protein